MATPALLAATCDFSVVLGGPLYQAYRRAHLSGPALELAVRRVIVIVAIAWLPLLVLSIATGTFIGGTRQPFALAIDVHARLLIALPLLIATECTVHTRLRITVQQFVQRDLLPPAAQPRFEAALASAQRLRNSVVAEVLLIAFVYFVGITVIWRDVGELRTDTWYRQVGDGAHITLPGWWYFFVSLPVFQFLLFRWYYRLLVWAWFLWKVSRGPLDLVPTHPDRCGGLGFLGLSTLALVPLLFAHGTLFAGVAGAGILFDKRELVSYWPELLAATVLLLIVALSPLAMFVPMLFRTKRNGLAEYGALAQRYVRDFDRKWLHGRVPDEPLLGAADIQSLADLTSSFEVVAGMRFLAVNRRTVLTLALATLLPMVPLIFTVFSPREVVALLWKGVF
jgi:hypothetical protein